MDPWIVLPSNVTNVTNGAETFVSGFENSFIEQEFDKCEKLVEFERLPDSSSYIARLEEKLGKLQKRSGGNQGRREEGRLLGELGLARKAALTGLITDDTRVLDKSDQEVEEDQELRSGYLVRKLVPEQAVTVGEKVVLTKADHLERPGAQEEEEEAKEDSRDIN